MNSSIGTAFIGLAAIAGLLYLVVAFFVQFYGQAIVIDGASAIDSFRTFWSNAKISRLRQ
ncbi:hypothetical protein C9J85_02320 [Haloferax sp. wsp5]|nr:hypothetical protein C9J85_02320 [Haloferax sp. wsp5]